MKIRKATPDEIRNDKANNPTNGKLWGFCEYDNGLVAIIRENWDKSDGWMYEIEAPKGYKFNCGEVRFWNCYTLKSAKEDCRSGIYPDNS